MCQIFRTQLTDYLERSLPLSDRERFEAHLSACEPCRSAMDVTRGMIVAYERLEEEPVPVGFEARWRQRLETVAPSNRPAAPWHWLKPLAPALRPVALGAVGAAVILIAVWLNPKESRIDNATTPQTASAPVLVEPVHVNLDQEHVLRVWFDAKERVEDVRFQLELPQGIALVTDQGMTPVSHVQWVGTLQAGRNLITIPVKGAERGRWTVTASIEKGSTRKERAIELLVNGI
jgi:anti-sigma factor RsiW